MSGKNLDDQTLRPSQQNSIEQEVFRQVWRDFLPYQQRYILDQSKLVIVVKSVRTGLTYAHAFKSMIKRTHPRRDRNTGKLLTRPIREIFASKNLRTATEYLAYHRQFARAYNAIFGQEIIDLSSWTSEIARYPFGNVEVYSSDPDNFRGLGGDVTLDEFAFHDQQELLYASAQGRITWEPDGQLTLISSHSHPETTFARIAADAMNKRNNFSLHMVTLEDAVAEGLAFKVPGEHTSLYVPGDVSSIQKVNAAYIASVRAQCLDDEQYMREYMCEPTGLGSIISAKQYDNLHLYDEQGNVAEVPEYIPNDVTGELYIGVDIGRSHDLTVIWVLERGYDGNRPEGQENIFRTCAVAYMRRADFDTQRNRIREFLSHPLVQAACIDSGGIGMQLAETLRAEFGGIVDAIQIGANRKAELCERVKRFVQQERVSLPRDGLIRSDLLAMRATPTSGGRIKYEGRTNATHCDFFMALSLALHAAATDLRLDLSVRRLSDQNRLTLI